MLQYLVILLDKSSVSYCHYPDSTETVRPMPLDTLKAGIVFAMKENLSIQFVYPDYKLPDEYAAAIESIDHVKIAPIGSEMKTDVKVARSIMEFCRSKKEKDTAYVVRCSKKEFLENGGDLCETFYHVSRLNIVITDIHTLADNEADSYDRMLGKLSAALEERFKQGAMPQLNLLTDRMMLDAMNNCDAGWKSLTLAPDGKLYVCPAFYYDDSDSVGEIQNGVDVKNQQLYRLDHAPICRHCDAYQCRRCIWLNKLTTLEANTPSHSQCLAAHLERNASRRLLEQLRKTDAAYMKGRTIKEIKYLDPFNEITNL